MASSSNSTPLCAQDSGSIALLLVATLLALVAAPAAGLMFAGAVRSKNALMALTHALSVMVIGSLAWFMYGFSIAFGPDINDKGFVGTPEWSFLVREDIPACYASAPSIPMPLFLLYQLAYALFAPAIITGVWAEKMTSQAMLIFSVLWPLMVYYFVAHWIWHENGWLNANNDFNVVDYNGGIVVLTTAGTAAFVLAVLLPGRAPALREPHSNPVHVVGALLMLVAWYALVVGSSFRTTLVSAVGSPSAGLLGAHMAAAGGAFLWGCALRAVDRRLHMRELLHGALAGLAGASAGVGFCAPYASLVVGVLCAGVALMFRRFARDVIWLDDALGVISIFGVPSTLGALLIAFVADTRYGAPLDGIFRDLNSGGKLFKSQITAVVCVVTWTVVMTVILVLALKRIVTVSVADKADDSGIDLIELGEKTYDDVAEQREQKLSPQQLAAKMNHYAAAGNVAELKRLLAAGASPSIVDYDYRTPAHFAAFQGHVNVLELLLEHQADLDAADNYGSTPMHAALAHGHVGTARWLEEHGAAVVAPLVPRAAATAAAAAAASTTSTAATTTAATAKKADEAQKVEKKDEKKDEKKTATAATTATTAKKDDKPAAKVDDKKKKDEKKTDAKAPTPAAKADDKKKADETDESSSVEYSYEYVEVSGSDDEEAVKKALAKSAAKK